MIMMRKATENHRNSGAFAEYFSPRLKVKDLTKKQWHPPQYAAFYKETPMKPSQVPNRLSHTHSKRTSAYQRPELWYQDRPNAYQTSSSYRGPVTSDMNSSMTIPQHNPKHTVGTSWHSSQPSEFTSKEPHHILGSINGYQPRPQDRVAPSQTAPQPPYILRPVTAEGSGNRTQLSFPRLGHHPANSLPHTRENFNNYSSSFSQVIVNRTEPNHPFSEMTREPPSSQSQQQQPMTRPQNPVGDLNYRSFQKPSESCRTSNLNPSPQLGNYAKTQTTMPTTQIPPRTLPVSQPSSKKPVAIKPSHVPQTKDYPPQTDTLEPSPSLKCSGFSKSKEQINISSPFQHCTKVSPITTASKTSLKSAKEDGTKGSKSGVLRTKSNTLLSPKVLQKPPNAVTQPVKRVRSESASSIVEQASKRKPPSSGHQASQHHKPVRPQRSSLLPDDLKELFTPDPMTYVVNPPHKTLKPKITDEKPKSAMSERDGPSHTTSSSRRAVCVSPMNKTAAYLSQASCPLLTSMPTVILNRINVEDYIRPKKKMKSTSSKSTNGHSKKESSKLMNSPLLGKDAVASEQMSVSPLVKQTADKSRKHVKVSDPIELDLNLDLRLALDFDDSRSSHCSEEEQLISLQDMLTRATKLPETPKKVTFSEPSTPGNDGPKSKNVLQLLPSIVETGSYKNNLDQMLKEINVNKRSKEIETLLRTACSEGVLRIAEYEQTEESQEINTCTEFQTKFLQRFSLVSGAFREPTPGEAVFSIEKFGHIFNQDSLQLRHCTVHPQGRAQKTLLWSSPAQLRLHVTLGLFQEAYDCHSPCPPQVMLLLFKMLSVHSERLVSDGLLQAMCDITCTAAGQIVNHGNQQFNVWVPSLADVTLILMNMGAAFVTLYPFEDLQPLFTEGDLLEDLCINSESFSEGHQNEILEHNFSNIFKYLSYSMSLCPLAYSDNELLLLLTMLGHISLDTRFIQPSVHLEALLYRVLNNFKEWDAVLPRICSALTSFTDDHRNMCLMVQALPVYKRGKQLRQHLSLCMISKLLDGTCTYKPTQSNFQLSEVRRYLKRMQPSSLLRDLMNTVGSDRNEDEDTLDQQAYYLCYSLLTLLNEATSLQFYTANQKKQVLILLSLLEVHIKCDIRESMKYLYRSKVKDLVSRIYTKWQKLVQRTHPLHNKLYDYWQPQETLRNNKQVKEEEDEATVIKATEETEEKATQEAVKGGGDMELDSNLEESDGPVKMDD
ncbi:SMC5-SMC6 complex localization factor protein 2 [Gouania willdenowi]|uniref:SMC5-SMC6 complex localization factor protein 2-like n=1 Tax=Gouania willdenowi TaxID=441366 RepID=A0A8C5NG50_GOUWI|nr:SMC5-SMC6 complex localization factor protein 2-like [Gouania willdenowi]